LWADAKAPASIQADAFRSFHAYSPMPDSVNLKRQLRQHKQKEKGDCQFLQYGKASIYRF